MSIFMRGRKRLLVKPVVYRQRGFSLIEVLVTMLILTFGLLGVAGLLINGIANAAASEAMTKATQLAADISDRMRANPTVALSATSQYITTYTDVAPTDQSTIANIDKKAWMDALAAQLPQGKGQITVDNPGRKITIQIRWSSCLGTLSDAENTACTNDSGSAFKTFTTELRL